MKRSQSLIRSITILIIMAGIIYTAAGSRTIENGLIHPAAESRRKGSDTAYPAAGYTTLIFVLVNPALLGAQQQIFNKIGTHFFFGKWHVC